VPLAGSRLELLTLLLATAFFLGIHFGIAATGLRTRAITMLGDTLYRAAFSIASAAGIVWMSMAYSSAPYIALWTPMTGFRLPAMALVLIAFLFVVCGLLTPNPTAVMGERLLDADDRARGVLRITRHPFLWGVALWALTHLLLKGDFASLVFFGGLFALSVAGTRSIDARRARSEGVRWEAFAARTSNLPFQAILQRRNELQLAEIGLWRFAAAVIAYLVFLGAHRTLFGASPLPLVTGG